MSVNIINQNALGSNPIAEQLAVTSTKVMTNGDVIFTSVGDIQILDLYSECVTLNGAGATTVQYSITPTIGTATTISGASASLANAPAGAILVLTATSLSTAPTYASTGVALGSGQGNGGVIFTSGNMTLVVATGPTTGTWKHYLRYRALEPNAYVVAG